MSSAQTSKPTEAGSRSLASCPPTSSSTILKTSSVGPKSFQSPIYGIPWPAENYQNRWDPTFLVLGRLRAGATLAKASDLIISSIAHHLSLCDLKQKFSFMNVGFRALASIIL